MDKFRVTGPREGKRCHRRGAAGVSMTELLVSVLVMGIAIAGVSEAAWLNSAWANMVQHKMDNQYSCKNFLSQLASELAEAVSVTAGSSDSLEFQTTDYKTGKVTSIKYTVDLTTNTMKKSIDNLSSNVVLAGVMGPVSAGTTTPAVFGYVDSSYVNGEAVDLLRNAISPNFGAHTVLVVVDLDLASSNVAVNRGAFGGPLAVKSACSMRREIFLRNNCIHVRQN